VRHCGVCELGYDAFRTRPVAVGSGWIDIQHGRYPVPAPATLRILSGLTLTGMELAGECTTPTGAALLAALTQGAPAPAEFVAGRTSFGAGTRDPQDRPNVLRLIEAAETAASAMFLLQSDIDDMAPEYAAAAQDALLASGALDVVIGAIAMKKGRPGMRFEVLVGADRLDEVEQTLFLTTPTIGARRWPVQRTVLPRRMEERTWRGQTIRWKVVELPDGSSRGKPEFADVVRAAQALGMTPWQLRAELDAARPGDTNGGAAV
jgi:pyridinium-3,5-bisthiocarboxylic acid mononucleotide nickel chelatase